MKFESHMINRNNYFIVLIYQRGHNALNQIAVLEQNNLKRRNNALNKPQNIMDLSDGKGIVYDSFLEDAS